MSTRGWASAILASCLLLTGCSAQPADDPADVSLHLQQRLDEAFAARFDGVDRPVAVPVRFVLPNGWAGLMRNCMNTAGFTAVGFDREQGFTNVEKTGEGALAWYECTQRLPRYDTVFARLSDEQLDQLYEYDTEVLVPCAGAIGLPVQEVPSREDFADGGEGIAGWWHPFLAVAVPSSRAAVDLLFAKCDPYPTAVRP